MQRPAVASVAVADPRPPLRSEGGEATHGRRPILGGNRLTPNGLAVFYRSLATMFAAGVHIDRALALLGEQYDDLYMAEISRGLGRHVTAGASLSRGMGHWPDVFSPMQIKLVQVGETSGHMDKILDRLGAYEEKRRHTGMRISSALTYPILLFVLAMAALVLVPPYLFGGLFQLIQSSGVEIPPLTRVMLAVSKVVSTPWFYLGLVVAGAAAGRLLPPVWRQPHVRRRLAGTCLQIPTVGRALRIMTVCRFARSLEILLGVGIAVNQALEMAFDASGSPVLQERLPQAIARIQGGGTMEDSLRDADFFPRAFLQMVAVGEETGRLPDLIAKLADLYEMELEYNLEAAIAALEPVMLLFMGVVVGLVIVATMLPMMQVIQNL